MSAVRSDLRQAEPPDSARPAPDLSPRGEPTSYCAVPSWIAVLGPLGDW